MIHFHTRAVCIDCTSLREFTTPIPQQLILATACEECRSALVVGLIEEGPCLSCLRSLCADLLARGLSVLLSDSRA